MKLFSRRLAAAAVFPALLLFPLAISGGQQDVAGIPGFSPMHAQAERELEEKFRNIPDAAHAESNLLRLTSEPHRAGTEASHRVAEWLRAQYRNFGFDTEIETYKVWLPEPREIKLDLIAPVQRSLASPEQPIEGDRQTYDPRAGQAFNAYSASGDVTAPVIYVNYGMPEDYRDLAALGVSVQGKIVLARYGQSYRGIKTKLAEEHKAAGVILYSDPEDDGYAAGDAYPRGPWRPMSGVQRGSVMYTQIYPGDPLTPGVAATAAAKRIAPADAANLSHIPTMPVSAQDAAVIFSNLGGAHVPRGWQGGLPITYHVGGGETQAHMKVAMDYAERPIYDVIAKLHGANDNEWVVLGNHHDAWVFGAADPGSGTSAMLETARALGELVKAGWKPRRTIVICHWDAEEPGLIGSTEWVEEHRAELQAKAFAYINTDVGVTGPNFAASAIPSLQDLVRDATKDVEDPGTHGNVYDAWREEAAHAKAEGGTARQAPPGEASGKPPLGTLGAGSDFSPFLDYAGIPSVDLSFGGDYGVYHSIYDDFDWMKKFGDATFGYHVALARVLGTIALRLDESDVLPFDYSAYAAEIGQETGNLAAAAHQADESASIQIISDASAKFSASAMRASQALRAISSPLDPATGEAINRSLAGVEHEFLAPDGLAGRPWFKHTLFAPGSYTGYAAEVMPGVTEALAGHEQSVLRREAGAVAAALGRGAAKLDDIARMAQQENAPSAQVRLR